MKTISEPNEPANNPDLALNGGRRAVVVWLRDDGGDAFAMRAAKRVPGKGFQAPRTLGPASFAAGANPPSFAKVAIDRAGNAVAVWVMEDADGDPHVVASFQPRGGQFGDVETLSQEAAFQPDVAFDAGGRAIAVWQRLEPTLGHDPLFNVQAAVKPAGGRDFGQPQTLSALGLNSQIPQVGISDSGRAVVVWEAAPPQPGAGHFVQAAINPAGNGGGFGAPQSISDPDLDADRPLIAVAANGRAMATWRATDPRLPAIQQVGDVGTAFAPRGGPFQPPEAIAHQTGMDAFNPQIAIDGRGRATVLWYETPPLTVAGTRLVRVARANRGGEFTGEQTLERTDGDVIDNPALAVARAGNAVGAWIREPISDPAPVINPLEVALRGRGKTQFGPTQTLSPPGSSAFGPSLATNRGLAIAIWELDKPDENGNPVGAGIVANVYR